MVSLAAVVVASLLACVCDAFAPLVVLPQHRAAPALPQQLRAAPRAPVTTAAIKGWQSRHRREMLRAMLALEESARRASFASQQEASPLAGCAWLWHSACAGCCTRLYQMLYPSEFGAVRRWHASKRRMARSELSRASARIDEMLPYALGGAAKATVSGRVKSARSVFEKARLRGSRVDDLLALRVIVEGGDGVDAEAAALAEADAISQCHAVETLVGAIWPDSIVGSKDYVASPKGNGYRSLHVSVRLPCGAPLEVQIRTRGMHELAEHGTAAHAAYKRELREGYLGDDRALPTAPRWFI